MFKVGAELRSNFPYTAIFPEKIQNRFSESIWNTVDVQRRLRALNSGDLGATEILAMKSPKRRGA
jgi:hypothetical protein